MQIDALEGASTGDWSKLISLAHGVRGLGELALVAFHLWLDTGHHLGAAAELVPLGQGAERISKPGIALWFHFVFPSWYQPVFGQLLV